MVITAERGEIKASRKAMFAICPEEHLALLLDRSTKPEVDRESERCMSHGVLVDVVESGTVVLAMNIQPPTPRR